MSVNRRGLGMGLSALLGDSIEKDIALEGKQMIALDIRDIAANKDQPRKNFKEENIKDLAKSIEENGLIQPIVVTRSDNGKYMIIAGERRFRATKMLGLEKIDAIVIDVKTVDEILHKALIENIQREDLSPIEEALAYRSIIEKTSITHQDLADKIGKSRSHISNMIRILVLPEDILKMVDDGSISFGHAKLLVSTQNPLEYAERIKNGMTVRDLESTILIEKRGLNPILKNKKIGKLNLNKDDISEDEAKEEKEDDKDKLYNMIKELYLNDNADSNEDGDIRTEDDDDTHPAVIENIQALEKYIRQRFNIKFSLETNGDKSGYIKIEYDDLDELESVVDKLF